VEMIIFGTHQEGKQKRENKRRPGAMYIDL
jgi:hypothetical protein